MLPFDDVIMIRSPYYQYRDFHYKNKTVPPPPYLYNWNHIPGKMAFVLKRGPGSLKILSIKPIDAVSAWGLRLPVVVFVYGTIS